MKRNAVVAIFLILMVALTGCTVEEKPLCCVKHTETLQQMSPPERIPQVKTQEETELPLFSEDITFTGEYVSGGELMPYALFMPSIASQEEALPLIVWLHGMSERGANGTWFLNAGLPQVLQEWSLDGFRAYVLCPQLSEQGSSGTWCSNESAVALRQLLDAFVAKHNVDTEHIIIGGFSLGGRGAMYMALDLEGYFSRLVVLSSLSLDERDIREIDIPTIGCSEYAVSWNAFMKTEFPEVFGNESVLFYDATHIELIGAVFNDDRDCNHRSDIVEWMLADCEDSMNTQHE